MITRFEKRPIFFPVKWANEIVDWIVGIHSETGTIKVKNTLNPDESGSLSLDVDVQQLTRLVEESLKKRAT